MKAYKIELLVLDWDGLGSEGVKSVIENSKYPNWCISPKVQAITGRDIGEWSDDNPLNHPDTRYAEYKRLFEKEEEK